VAAWEYFQTLLLITFESRITCGCFCFLWSQF